MFMLQRLFSVCEVIVMKKKHILIVIAIVLVALPVGLGICFKQMSKNNESAVQYEEKAIEKVIISTEKKRDDSQKEEEMQKDLANSENSMNVSEVKSEKDLPEVPLDSENGEAKQQTSVSEKISNDSSQTEVEKDDNDSSQTETEQESEDKGEDVELPEISLQ